MKTKQMILCALFAALIAIGAFLRIPLPAIPMTMQVLFVILSGLLLGPRYGAAAALLYMALGLIGLPIFTEGGGIFYVLKPTFGYILAFPIGAWIVGRMTSGASCSFWRRLGAGLCGVLVIYFIGIAYFQLIRGVYFGTPMPLTALIAALFLPFIPGDVISCVLAAFLSARLSRFTR